MSAFPPEYIRAHLVALGCDPTRVEESFVHSSGAGGQNVNKVATCVQLRYAPRNILLKMQEHRTQASNRLAAWKLLAEQLQRLNALWFGDDLIGTGERLGVESVGQHE